MAQAVRNLCVCRKVFLKHRVNWNTVCGAIPDLPWRNIFSSDNPVKALKGHLLLLVGRYVPINVIRVLNKDKLWFDDQCRHAFGIEQEAHLGWIRDRSRINWEEYVRCQVRANGTYSEAKRQFRVRKKVYSYERPFPHQWWSTLKSAVFGLSSSSPHLGGGGGLVCESGGKADLLTNNFDGKQSRESIFLPLTCHQPHLPPLFAFRSSEVRRLLSYLDPYGGTDPLGVFPLFLRELPMFWPTNCG